jgi:arylsulfatase I/J
MRRSAAALALLALAARSAAPPPPPRPHIIVHIVDDWGHANFGANYAAGEPHPEVATPAMDALAASGLVLERFYVHKMCSPSRSSLQSGRLPIHVNVINSDVMQRNASDPEGGAQGVPESMTGLGEVMRAGGYRTNLFGKWNAGCATFARTPMGRGYNTSLVYFGYRNDYWSEQDGACEVVGGGVVPLVDLWDGAGPAVGQNNSFSCSQANQAASCVYEDELFLRRVLETIEAHDAATPLFLVWASHGVHTPYEVPDRYLQRFAFIDQEQRRFYAAMVAHTDDMVANVTAALKRKGLWDSTLYLTVSDNGGPVTNGTGANNHPLRGGKLTNFEGGVRANAFAAGGFLAPEVRGTRSAGLVAIADLYTTFAALAGVDPTDHRAAAAGLPPVDGLDVSALFTVANATSPRKEVPLGIAFAPGDDDPPAGPTVVQGLIRADGFKLLLGQIDGGFWQGPTYPNTSGWPAWQTLDCGQLNASGDAGASGGCLFDVFADPNEHNDIAAQFPAVVAEMRARIAALQLQVYSPLRGDEDPQACAVAVKTGFFSPWVNSTAP